MRGNTTSKALLWISLLVIPAVGHTELAGLPCWARMLIYLLLGSVCQCWNAIGTSRYGLDPSLSHCEVNWGNPPPTADWDTSRIYVQTQRIKHHSFTVNASWWFLTPDLMGTRIRLIVCLVTFNTHLTRAVAVVLPVPRLMSLIWYNGLLGCH